MNVRCFFGWFTGLQAGNQIRGRKEAKFANWGT
jgi:hypothetical protein